MCVCAYTHAYTHTHIYLYIYIYLHTYIYAHSNTSRFSLNNLSLCIRHCLVNIVLRLPSCCINVKVRITIRHLRQADFCSIISVCKHLHCLLNLRYSLSVAFIAICRIDMFRRCSLRSPWKEYKPLFIIVAHITSLFETCR